MVAPALEHYNQNLLLGEVWQRPGMSQRDRSIVTLAVLIARNAPGALPFDLNRALDSGVKPAESVRDHHASGLPSRLAERVLGHAGLQGSV